MGLPSSPAPDLQSVAKLVAADLLTEPAYQSPAGPITPLDILYGHNPSLAKGNLYMAHKCGFTKKFLISTLEKAQFKMIACVCNPRAFALWALASKSLRSEVEMRELAHLQFQLF